MATDDIVRYRRGMSIDPARILEIIDLPRDQWGPIERVYAEVRAAGAGASFRGQRNTTIFPPELVSGRLLKLLASIESPAHHIYPVRQDGKLVAVLVHVVGGYASVHIYRLRPSRRR